MLPVGLSCKVAACELSAYPDKLPGVISRQRTSLMGKMAGCKLFCVFTWILLVSTGTCLAGLSCMDMNGNPVDWFIVYKLPIDSGSTVPSIKNGTAFLYMDVNSQSFKLSGVSLDNRYQSIGFTLQQIYSKYTNQAVGYGMYNDEHPDGKVSDARGHTKGVVAFDSNAGFWLVHSVPKFPNPGNSRYAWPENARRNGQSLLCLTLGYNQFEEIGKNVLMYTWPFTYDVKITGTLTSGVPSLVKGLSDEHVEAAPWNMTATLRTMGGQKFLSFARSREFAEELYCAWVAPYFHSDLYTETWQNGHGKLPSCCNVTYKVENVETVTISGIFIKETKDHSKWAVTTSNNVQWTCIGDLNRMEHQKVRGGGTVCVNLPRVWSAFNSAVKTYEAC